MVTPTWCACKMRCSSELNAASDRKSTRLNSSHSQISYAVFCLKKKNNTALQLNTHPFTHPTEAIRHETLQSRGNLKQPTDGHTVVERVNTSAMCERRAALLSAV